MRPLAAHLVILLLLAILISVQGGYKGLYGEREYCHAPVLAHN